MTLKNYLLEKYSKTSIRGYENMIKRFKITMGDRAEKATYTEILEYIGILRNQNLHPKSLRNNLFAVKIYFNYLLAIKKRKDHPCKYLILKDQINRQIQVESLYTKEILEALYENHQSINPQNQNRDLIIISLLIYQALTVLEISQLKKEEVSLEKGTIKIRENKKNRGRVLHLKSNQILLIHEYLKNDWKKLWKQQKPKHRQLYFILSNEGKQIWKSGINRMINRGKVKYEKITPLKIRQSVIANLLKEKNDTRVVQEFAGHRRTSSTEAYKQTGLEELKQSINKFHPLQ